MALEYRDIAKEFASTSSRPQGTNADNERVEKPARVSFTEEELARKLLQASEDARRAIEEKLRREYAKQIEAEHERIRQAISGFQIERAEYYSRVEPELVSLVLAVAGRILHREAQVDRMLLAALAKIAVENLQQRSHVVVRVAPEACPEWREYFASHLSGAKVEVLEDSQLQPDGCVLETELGTADVSIDAQLKEIERGLFDLLAKRPESR
jgi:flagellar assembly protein FliH